MMAYADMLVQVDAEVHYSWTEKRDILHCNFSNIA